MAEDLQGDQAVEPGPGAQAEGDHRDRRAAEAAAALQVLELAAEPVRDPEVDAGRVEGAGGVGLDQQPGQQVGVAVPAGRVASGAT